MSDWSAPTILTFLEAYQNEPCLWNSKDADHKNWQKVNDAWTRLSIIMNKSVKELKTKKEILMATFRRHLKKKNDSIRSGAGSDDVYKPIWFAYDLMDSFLGPVYTCSNNVNSEERALSEENETAAIEDEEVVDNNDLEQPLRTPKPDCHNEQTFVSYKDYSEDLLNIAVGLVENKNITSYEAEKQFGIPRRTILNKVKQKHLKNIGCPTKLSPADEQKIASCLILCGV
ncbi:unnamed protein product [Euphydryas editha]|uniref:MADF domain-containing protein n=1 Tax=Euphydryas editha TaxID=104508 RepID=A0AAU9UND8_EUPED|nr:unnamed protein product [Euphydryas editha]